MTKTPKNIADEQGRLETDRKDYEPLKQLCTALSYPGRSDKMDYYSTFDPQKGKSNTKSRKIYDPTAINGLEIWSSGVIGHYMPKDVNWFAEEMSEISLRESKRIRTFLQDTDEHLRSVLNRSNYYEQKLVTIRDSAAIGDSFIFIDEDKQDGKQMMLAPHPREFWVRRDWWGRVSVIHHKFANTLQNIVEEFGKAALSADQQLRLKESPHQKIEVIHAVYRNPDYNPESTGVKYMLWQHYYLNVSAKEIMRETGTYTLNPVPWSLNRPSHETYGRGIVSQMLIEILTCNFMSKDMLIAGQTAASPPMLVTSALKHKLDLGAGAVTFASSRETQGLKMGDLIARLIDSSGYPFGADNHQRWQAMVENRFGVPLFLSMNNTTAKTAYEVRQRQAERATLMAPFLGTLGTTTDMEFDRIYSIEAQAGRAPEPPQEILDAQNGRIDIQYIGPLFQLLQQYYETGNLLTTIANIRETLSVAPDSAMVVEGDELMRKILQSGNTPEEIIRSSDDVMELRAIAAQQEEAMMQAELAKKTSEAVPNLSGKIEKDSVLSKLVEEAA